MKQIIRQVLPRPILRRLRRLRARTKVPYHNIYHCCSWKTASQWIRAVFEHPVVYARTGLEPYNIEAWLDRILLTPAYRGMTQWELEMMLLRGHRCALAIPRYTIGLCLYLDYESYQSIPKPKSYRTFAVLRDPRDLVVSWYFSILKSHVEKPNVLEERATLAKLSQSEGFKYSIRRLHELGVFRSQRSWAENASRDSNVHLVYYEDLAKDHRIFLADLFDHLKIRMPEDEFHALCDATEFAKFTKGRQQGDEAITSHYRKGIAGDWKQYFDEEMTRYFGDATGNLLEVLGYER